MSIQPQTQYPTNKKELWGPAFWTVQHELAAEFPENPDRTDRMEYARLFHSLVRHLPCEQECRPHAEDYLSKYPLRFENRRTLSEDVCKFHNHVNRTTGKEIEYDCSQILNKEACATCSLERKAAVVPDITSSFENYKTVSTKIFEDLCKRSDIPLPNISFAPCPGNESTSCVRYKEGEKPTVYLNPYSVSLRQTLHEFDHYRDYIAGKREFQEEPANRYAYELISKEFPIDNVNKLEESQTIKDETPEAQADVDLIKQSDPNDLLKDYTTTNEWYNITDEMGTTEDYETRFPYYQKTMLEINQRKQYEAEQHKRDAGVIGHLDSIFKIPGDLAGVRAQEMNLAHTPQIIKSGIMTIIESNTTPLGSALFSFGSGIALFIAGIFTNATLGNRDKIALQHLSASFLWNTLRYSNPKLELKNHIRELFARSSSGHLSFNDLMIETPGMYRLKQIKKEISREAEPPLLPHQKITGYYGPHTALARTYAGEDLSQIRGSQNLSQSRTDSYSPASTPVYSNITPEEERRLRFPVGQQSNEFGRINPSWDEDDYSSTSDEEDADTFEYDVATNPYNIPMYRGDDGIS